MTNNLQDAVAQVPSYLVVAVGHLRHVSLDLAELTIVKSKCDELRQKVLGLEEEKRKFEERYDMLAREKDSMDDQVTSLDREVE